MPWLITAAQLDKFRKNQKNLIILDASYHMDGRDARQEYLDKHIVDAQFFDITRFSDPESSLPHMLTHDSQFISNTLGQLGIRNDYKIILYDNSELHSAARALWMFKMFGHNPHLLYILDGGLKAFENYGGKTTAGPLNLGVKSYNVQLQMDYLATLTDIKKSLSENTHQIIDLRHPVRFIGGKEARPGLRSGHIPGSVGLPFISLFDKDGCFLPLNKIRKKLLYLNINLNIPIITTCGSGITAAILNFVLDIMSQTPNSLYDGSWSEYGADSCYPGEENLLARPVETYVEKSF